MATSEDNSTVILPRVTIKFCTQCKWMLRAAYFAQELLSTFSTSLGEVSLIPSTGGIFTIDIVHHGPGTNASPRTPTSTQLWDRKTNGGFPEVKHLKQLVRNVIDPGRDLGHVDRHHGGKEENQERKDVESETQTGLRSKGDGELEGNGISRAAKQSLEGDVGTSTKPVAHVELKNGKQQGIYKDCD